jgi:predicted  nucleic acid-binding Zn-ribbon protein
MTSLASFKYVFQCAHCGADFGANQKNKIYCGKRCNSNSFRSKNPDREAAYARKSRANNPERSKKAQAIYYEKHREEAIARSAAYYLKNGDKLRQKSRDKNLENPSRRAGLTMSWLRRQAAAKARQIAMIEIKELAKEQANV